MSQILHTENASLASMKITKIHTKHTETENPQLQGFLPEGASHRIWNIRNIQN
jgi:hypothetical protein